MSKEIKEVKEKPVNDKTALSLIIDGERSKLVTVMYNLAAGTAEVANVEDFGSDRMLARERFKITASKTQAL